MSAQVLLCSLFHLRRTQTDHNHEEGHELRLDNLEEVSIAQLSDGVIALERINKVDLNTLLQLLESSRIDTGETGVAGQLPTI